MLPAAPKLAPLLAAIETADLRTEEIATGIVAGIARMSKYHFLRTFRRIVGLTPYQFLLNQRIRGAARRLTMSQDTVSSIAFESGFGDLSTFNSRFRSVFGMRPLEHRHRQRKGHR